MSGSMFARQSVERLLREQEGAVRPPRLLGARSLTALGVSGIIGTGIFIMTGMAARALAGPALMVSFVIAAVACMAAALCYAEFAAAVPIAGSAYTYAYVTLGEVFAWIVGWNMMLEYGLAAASVAQGWSHYCQSLLGSLHLGLPPALTGTPTDVVAGHLAATGALLDLPALLICAIITLVVVRGIRMSLTFSNAMLILKLGIILFVIVIGAFHVHPANWHPFAPYGWSGIGVAGRTILGQSGQDGSPVGVLAGAALVFYAYLGFEALTAYTEETRRPARNVPLAIVVSLLICTVLYIAVTAVLTGMVPYTQIDMRAPLSEAFQQIGMPWARLLIALGATIGITSVLFIILMSYPRILMAIGRDGFLPRRLFADLHPRFQTPWRGILTVGVAVSLLSALVPLQLLANLVVMATFFGFVLVSAAVLILRRNRGEGATTFRAPFGPLVPLLSIGSCLLLMLALPGGTWLHLGLWLLFGLAVYVGYGRKHSVLNQRAEN